ncbi:MAG: response regulator [Ignavibacteriaceae bacterium]
MIERKSFKILIVEDEEISQNLYRLMLKDYAVSFCDSDKSMYNKLSDDNYELIIMDIGLPCSKDGLVLIKELKDNKIFFKIPIICITSYVSYDQEANAIKAGADAYITKPISKNVLITTIEYFLT